MHDPLPLPGVSDVDLAVAGLDDGGIGILTRLAFDDDGGFP